MFIHTAAIGYAGAGTIPTAAGTVDHTKTIAPIQDALPPGHHSRLLRNRPRQTTNRRVGLAEGAAASFPRFGRPRVKLHRGEHCQKETAINAAFHREVVAAVPTYYNEIEDLSA